MNTKSLTADKIYTCITISRSALKCDKTLKLVDEHCILIIMIIDKLMKENGIINTSMNKVILQPITRSHIFFFDKGLSIYINLSVFLSAGKDKLYLN